MTAIDRDQISFQDCCRLILENTGRGRATTTSERAKYQSVLLSLLNQEFGISWQDGGMFSQEPRVAFIAQDLADYYASLASPFERMYEYTPIRGENAVWTRHRMKITDTTAVLRQCYVEFFRDLLLLRWPEARNRMSSWTQLQKLGLQLPEEDPFDD